MKGAHFLMGSKTEILSLHIRGSNDNFRRGGNERSKREEVKKNVGTGENIGKKV